MSSLIKQIILTLSEIPPNSSKNIAAHLGRKGQPFLTASLPFAETSEYIHNTDRNMSPETKNNQALLHPCQKMMMGQGRSLHQRDQKRERFCRYRLRKSSCEKNIGNVGKFPLRLSVLMDQHILIDKF